MTPSVSIMRRVEGSEVAWSIALPEEKLRWRAALPGASIYDRVAHVFRSMQADGVSGVELLPAAMPAAWLVNAGASSRAMQRWLSRPAADAWAALLEIIAFDASPEEWLADEQRIAVIPPIVEVLATGTEGASLVAVTKILAVLRPQLVPLMDDAALSFALSLVPMPETADRPVATASAFVPMLDWFAQQIIANEPALIALAAGHDAAVLDAAQVLDRLLWMESWGDALRTGARPVQSPPSTGTAP